MTHISLEAGLSQQCLPGKVSGRKPPQALRMAESSRRTTAKAAALILSRDELQSVMMRTRLSTRSFVGERTHMNRR